MSYMLLRQWLICKRDIQIHTWHVCFIRFVRIPSDHLLICVTRLIGPMYPIHTRNTTHLHVTCHIHESIMSHTRMNHVTTHMNGAPAYGQNMSHTCEWVMRYTKRSHWWCSCSTSTKADSHSGRFSKVPHRCSCVDAWACLSWPYHGKFAMTITLHIWLQCGGVRLLQWSSQAR